MIDPTPEDLEQAARLAAWLAHGLAEGELADAPEGVDLAVAGAVLGLRPDLARAHGVELEAVLLGTTEGPFASPELRAALLALRPDLAPPHRVSIDAVLGEVRAGPFAPEAQGGEVVGAGIAPAVIEDQETA